MPADASTVFGIDLFCGAGGLSHGLRKAGISVVAGIDIDPACKFPFESNIEASFLLEDVREIKPSHLTALWPKKGLRLLAGCAPCQPFSPHRRGIDTSKEDEWSLLEVFGRLVRKTKPDLVTMENVPRIGSTRVFADFVNGLAGLGYHVDWKSCYGPDYGLAQSRRRLVLLASLLGPIEVPDGDWSDRPYKTVKDRIGKMPPLESGASHAQDRLHRTRELSATNRKRIRASKPGGTWEDWPESLRSPCHRKKSGSTFRNVYARMEWDQPAPTITTLAHNFGAGRFGHPDQDRPISLREAAMLQGFPRRYRFVAPGDLVSFHGLGRLIGNAVPPPIANAIGKELLAHAHTDAQRHPHV
jgi:DNA (cytosine-5)-methyltransferase 1